MGNGSPDHGRSPIIIGKTTTGYENSKFPEYLKQFEDKKIMESPSFRNLVRFYFFYDFGASQGEVF